jgi:hypothetical protein
VVAKSDRRSTDDGVFRHSQTTEPVGRSSLARRGKHLLVSGLAQNPPQGRRTGFRKENTKKLTVKYVLAHRTTASAHAVIAHWHFAIAPTRSRSRYVLQTWMLCAQQAHDAPHSRISLCLLHSAVTLLYLSRMLRPVRAIANIATGGLIRPP